jgi:hypothetical protein
VGGAGADDNGGRGPCDRTHGDCTTRSRAHMTSHTLGQPNLEDKKKIEPIGLLGHAPPPPPSSLSLTTRYESVGVYVQSCHRVWVWQGFL